MLKKKLIASGTITCPLKLYTLTSKHRLSPPFPVHFLSADMKDLFKQSRASLVDDHFLHSLTLMFDSGIILTGKMKCWSLLRGKGLTI